jgi:hypothetical protein
VFLLSEVPLYLVCEKRICTAASFIPRPRTLLPRRNISTQEPPRESVALSGSRRPGARRTGEQLFHRIVKRFRGGLVPKTHRPLYHSTLSSSVIKKRKTTG